MNQSRRARGRWGEDRAAEFYRRAGYEIVDRNWRSSTAARRGEIDLIVRRGGLIAFCEVKARKSSSHGGAAIAVDGAKQEQVRALAELWLADHAIDLDSVEIRFDVIALDGTELTHLEAAF